MKRRENKFKAGRKPESKKLPRRNPRDGPPITLSAGRKWLFRFIAVAVVPLLLLGGLEMALRLAGYGYPTGFFKEIRVNGRDYLIQNRDFSLRFFPPSLARWPEPFIFPAVKPPNTVRIFIFGESAAMGDPQPAYAASRYLEVLLRDRFTGEKFEVINLGITAINSNVILPIARDCAKAGGDFWIIYMGNNEMVGPFGAATVFGAQAPPWWMVRLKLDFQKSRVGQLLMAIVGKLTGESKSYPPWGGMEMFLDNHIAPDDPRKDTVYRNFATNLRDVVEAGVDSGAKVILNTVSVNLKDCPPFASFGNTNLSVADRQQFDRIFSEAKALQSRSNYVAAAESFIQAIKLNPQYAEAHFRLGQCELAMTNSAAPREFQLACDDDALPFRADTRINLVIRQVAGQHTGNRLVLCDAEKDMAQADAAHVAGDETFFEHVHFNFDGNYRLGKIWAEQVGQILAAAGNLPATTNWADQATCDRALGLSIWNRQFVLESVIRRLGVPPLSTQFNNAERLEKLRAEELSLRRLEAQPGAVERVREEFATAIKNAPTDGLLYQGLANFLEAVNDPRGAIAAYRRLRDLVPDDFYADLQLGRLLGEQGQPEQGEAILEAATKLRPNVPDAWFELGNLLAAQGKYSKALDCMGRAARFYPRDPSYVCYTAQLLAKLNRHSEAIEQYRKVIQMSPDFWQAHLGLAGELVAVGQLEEAMHEYATVLKINPRHITARLNLGVLLLRFNHLDDAIACFQKALQIEPDNRAAREYLDAALAHKAQSP